MTAHPRPSEARTWACPRCGLRWGEDPLEVTVGPWCSGFLTGAEHEPMAMLPTDPSEDYRQETGRG